MLSSLLSAVSLALIVAAPAGWSSQTTNGTQYFFPPGSSRQTYEAVFPSANIDRTLAESASELWHQIVGSERVVDAKTQNFTAKDGTPACEILVASLDAQNNPVYRLFVVKQYGDRLAAGELRSPSVSQLQAVGKPALASLLEMRAAP